jgi:hypothetical protein
MDRLGVDRNLSPPLVLERGMDYGFRMKRRWRTWMPLLGMVWVLGGAQADVTSLGAPSYQTFVDRNPFGLKPVPTPAPVTVATSPPPVQVNIQLSGISSLGGNKRAWLVIPPGPGRTNTAYLSMSEGDPERDGIRIQSIDPERGVVQILNAGSPATLDFQTHGLAYRPPAAVNLPGQPQQARAARPGAPVVNPSRPTARITPGGQTTVAPGMVGGDTATQALRTIPSRNVRTSPPAPMPQVDPAIQAIQMRANELRARSQGVNYPPMPPIPGLP